MHADSPEVSRLRLQLHSAATHIVLDGSLSFGVSCRHDFARRQPPASVAPYPRCSDAMKEFGLMCVRLLGLLTLWAGSVLGWTDEYRHIEQDAYVLLTGDELSKAGFGMRVQGARGSGDTVRVTTTGGVLSFDKRAKAIALQHACQEHGRPPRSRSTTRSAGTHLPSCEKIPARCGFRRGMASSRHGSTATRC